VILQGCEATGAFEAFKAVNGGDEKAAEKACATMRTDGRSVDIDGDYTEPLARIESNKDGIGVFGLAVYENNTDKLQVATMSGVAPSTDSIASGEIPVSRPLYFYVKKAHIGVIPGLKEFAEFCVADEIAGPDRPLAEYALVSDACAATRKPWLPMSRSWAALERATHPCQPSSCWIAHVIAPTGQVPT